MQPSVQGSDNSEDAQIQLENPFDTPKWSRFDYTGGQHQWWTSRFLSCNPDEFIDLLNTIEKEFRSYYISNERNVKLAFKCIKGRALMWWNQLQISRQMKGKED